MRMLIQMIVIVFIASVVLFDPLYVYLLLHHFFLSSICLPLFIYIEVFLWLEKKTKSNELHFKNE